jgi:hypothetical protein
MHCSIKNILKSNYNHISKQTLSCLETLLVWSVILNVKIPSSDNFLKLVFVIL